MLLSTYIGNECSFLGGVNVKDVLIRAKKLASGKIVYEYRFEIASVNGKRKWQTKSGFATKKEAKEAGWLAQQVYENTGRIQKMADMSYEDFLNEWIDKDIRLSCKEETANGYLKRIRLYIKPALGSYRLKSITRENLQAFINDLYNKGFSVNSISSIKGILTKSFGYAVDEHYLMASPAVRLIIPRKMQPKVQTTSEPHVYIPDDVMIKIFERFPEGTSAYIPLMLGYRCGLRLGEIFGLVWEDVDLDNKLLTVNRQVQWKSSGISKAEQIEMMKNGKKSEDGYWYFSSPKYDSYRTITIDDELCGILVHEKNRQLKAEVYYDEYYIKYYSKYRLNFDGINSSKYNIPQNRIGTDITENRIHLVTIREDGSFINPRVMNNVSSVIHNKLNFPEYDTHSLRHTHATMLMENGVDLMYIKNRLGHKDISMTMNIYTNHMTDKLKKNNDDRMNNMFKCK